MFTEAKSRTGLPVLVVVLFSALLSACATPQSMTPKVDSNSAALEARRQQELVFEDFISSYQRLLAVSQPILLNGRELCGENVAPYVGGVVWNVDRFSNKTWQEIGRTKFSLGHELRYAYVVPGSPAELAGIRAGDELVSINDVFAPTGPKAVAEYASRVAAEGRFGAISFVIRRDGQEQTLSVTPETACKFTVQLVQDETKNAYADGTGIFVHKGMMDFVKSDEELALVVSHELAHDSMLHIEAQKKNATIGSILGAVVDVLAASQGVNTNGNYSRMGGGIGAGRFSVEFEQEADYVGLYFMTRAGYRIDGAANFWRRMAVADPRAITMKSSHPTSPERFVALEAAVAEIHGKEANGQPLTPEMKPKTAETGTEQAGSAIPGR